MFDGNGRLSLQEMRLDLPKFASNNRQEGTPEENKAIVQGFTDLENGNGTPPLLAFRFGYDRSCESELGSRW